MKTIEKYLSVDGKEFNTEEECIAHEKEITPRTSIVFTSISGNRETMTELFREKGIIFENKEAAHLASFALYEFNLEIQINHITGDTKLLSVNERKLID